LHYDIIRLSSYLGLRKALTNSSADEVPPLVRLADELFAEAVEDVRVDASLSEAKGTAALLLTVDDGGLGEQTTTDIDIATK